MMQADLSISIRVAKYLSIRLINGKYIASNEFVGTSIQLPIAIVNLATQIPNYESCRCFVATLSKIYSQDSAGEAIAKRLLDAGIFVECNGPLDKLEGQFHHWNWGKSTGAHFLATRRVRWFDETKELEIFGEKLKRANIPPLWTDIDETEEWHPLSVSVLAAGVHKLLAKRRSVRQFVDQPIESEKLGAILNAGLGITGFLKLPFRPTFPLRYSPSPGGLNCFTAYLFINKVQGIKRGIYRYNALRNQVKYIASYPSESLGVLFGNQQWASESAVMVVLAADYDKMSWKYEDASAFNSLLIESGHIAQNMLICAAEVGIGSVPTNAIDQARLEYYLGIQFPHQALTYSIGFGIQDYTRNGDYYSAASLKRLETILNE